MRSTRWRWPTRRRGAATASPVRPGDPGLDRRRLALGTGHQCPRHLRRPAARSPPGLARRRQRFRIRRRLSSMLPDRGKLREAPGSREPLPPSRRRPVQLPCRRRRPLGLGDDIDRPHERSGSPIREDLRRHERHLWRSTLHGGLLRLHRRRGHREARQRRHVPCDGRSGPRSSARASPTRRGRRGRGIRRRLLPLPQRRLRACGRTPDERPGTAVAVRAALMGNGAPKTAAGILRELPEVSLSARVLRGA